MLVCVLRREPRMGWIWNPGRLEYECLGFGRHVEFFRFEIW